MSSKTRLIRSRPLVRLGAVLAAAAVSVAAPLFVVIQRSFAAIEREEFLQQRALCEETSRRINARLSALLETERNRPVEEYGFLQISANTLDPSRNVAFSPLSSLNPSTGMPGAIGYFEIDPDGSLQTPILPRIDPQTLASQPIGDQAEVDQRIVARERLLRSVRAFFPFVAGNTPLPIVRRESELIALDALNQREIAKEFDILRSQRGILGSKVLPFGEILLYRVVDLKPGPFLQGIVVDQRKLLASVIEPAIEGSLLEKELSISALVRGTPVYVRDGVRGSPAPTTREWLERLPTARKLLDAQLAAPFEDITLIFAHPAPAPGRQRTAVTQLSWTVALLFVLACTAVYYATYSETKLAQEKENFVSAVTHELKTPLTSIRMYSEMLDSGWEGSEENRKSYYKFMRTESERLARLVTNVLSLAGIERETDELSFSPIGAGEVVGQVVAAASAGAKAAGFELQALTDGESATVTTNADVLQQILLNFVENAQKYARDASNKSLQVGFRVSQGGGRNLLEFFVRDFGPGVNPELRGKIFGLFTRGFDEKTRKHKGSGIGLALVKSLADRIGAEVGVREAAPGAEFWVRFKPLA